METGHIGHAVTLVFNKDMMAAAIILFLALAAIFLEGPLKIHRTKSAMLGAGAILVVGQAMGFFNPEMAMKAVDWNVIMLLGALMTVVAIMVPTGGFQAIAWWIAKVSRGRQFPLMAMMGTAIAVISMLLDNVTTIIIFSPLIVIICQVLKISPVPYLVSGAILSNTGGVATLVGDPPNILIGSAAGIDFMTFVVHMFGLVVCAWLATVYGCKYMFRHDLAKTTETPVFSDKDMIEDKYTWYVSLFVLAVMVVFFVFHGQLHWEAWVVASLGLTLLVVLLPKLDLDPYLEKAELSLLLFLIALFVLVGGVEKSGFLYFIGQQIRPLVEGNLLFASIFIMWAAAILSAFINNIPLMAGIIPIIIGMESQGTNVTPLWWALAAGVGLGGNATHVGSAANVYVVSLSERIAKRENDPSVVISAGLWARKGAPVMILTLVVSSIVIAMFFDFFSRPIH